MTTTRTVISFFVSVPVLSDAITLAEPNVSTAARCRTMALRRAIRWTPMDSTAVTTAGNPSGTAATAVAVGEAGIAAPIRGYGGLVVGAIGVSGAVERICDTRRQPNPVLVAYVRDAARAVSRDLGAGRW